MQGGIHPDLPGTAYFDLVRAVKARVPEHARARVLARWRSSTAPPGPDLSIRDWLIAAKEAGLDSLPGTAAEILDDDVRWVLTKGKLPTATWVEVITHRARAGHPDDVDDDVRPRGHPAHWVGAHAS